MAAVFEPVDILGQCLPLNVCHNTTQLRYSGWPLLPTATLPKPWKCVSAVEARLNRAWEAPQQWRAQRPGWRGSLRPGLPEPACSRAFGLKLVRRVVLWCVERSVFFSLMDCSLSFWESMMARKSGETRSVNHTISVVIVLYSKVVPEGSGHVTLIFNSLPVQDLPKNIV